MSFKIGVLIKFCNIHRKVPVLESLFNKVAGLKDTGGVYRTPPVAVSQRQITFTGFLL